MRRIKYKFGTLLALIVFLLFISVPHRAYGATTTTKSTDPNQKEVTVFHKQKNTRRKSKQLQAIGATFITIIVVVGSYELYSKKVKQ